MNLELIFIFPLIVSALLAYGLTPLSIWLAWKLDLIDDPKKNKHPKVIHTKPTPRAGGLAIFLAIAITSIVFLPLDKHLIGILSGALLLTVIGLLDDKYNINPYLRLAGQFIAVGLPIISGIGIAFVTNPLSGALIDLSQPRISFFILGETRSIWLLSDAFALLWIVMIINFLNWGAKGVDGQLSGVVVVAAVTIALLSLKFSADIAEWPVIILAAILAGSFAGFLPWHKFPQKIMPSFSGSNIAGYLLGILSILTTTKVGVLAIVLAIPLIDSGYTIFRRISSGRSPVWGDRGHLHHKLLDNGWSKSKIAYFYWFISMFLGIIALSLNSETKLYTMIGVAFLVGGLLLWLTYRPKQR